MTNMHQVASTIADSPKGQAALGALSISAGTMGWITTAQSVFALIAAILGCLVSIFALIIQAHKIRNLSKLNDE